MSILDLFSPKSQQLRLFRMEIYGEANTLIQSLGIDPYEELRMLLTTEGTNLGHMQPTGDGSNIFTPRQIFPLLSALMEYPATVSAVMITEQIQLVAKQLMLPKSLGNDLMMSLEGIRAFAPERIEQAADILAVSIVLMPFVRLARTTFREIGQPYTPAWLSPRDFHQLDKAGFVREPMEKAENGRVRLLQDVELRNLVKEKLMARNPEAAQVIVN